MPSLQSKLHAGFPALRWFHKIVTPASTVESAGERCAPLTRKPRTSQAVRKAPEYYSASRFPINRCRVGLIPFLFIFVFGFLAAGAAQAGA